MKRTIAIIIIALAFTALNVWHATVEAQRTTVHAANVEIGGNVVVSGTAIIVLNATNPAVVATDSTNTVTTKVQSQDSQGFIGTSSNHDLRIMTDNAAEMTILAAGNVGIGTTSPAAGLHGVVGSGAFLWANSEADNTEKFGLWGVEHYDVDEEPFYVIMPDSNNGTNILNIGGGTAGGNAATLIQFLTAANSTTTTGTVRAQINAAGQFLFGDGAVGAPAISNIGDTNTGIYFSATDQLSVTVGGGIAMTFAAAGISPFKDFTMGTRHIHFAEDLTPPAGVPGIGIMFSKDNGGGKTQLCVEFETGAAQCFATEP